MNSSSPSQVSRFNISQWALDHPALTRYLLVVLMLLVVLCLLVAVARLVV